MTELRNFGLSNYGISDKGKTIWHRRGHKKDLFPQAPFRPNNHFMIFIATHVQKISYKLV